MLGLCTPRNNSGLSFTQLCSGGSGPRAGGYAVCVFGGSKERSLEPEHTAPKESVSKMSPDRGERLNVVTFFPFKDPPLLRGSFAQLLSQGV